MYSYKYLDLACCAMTGSGWCYSGTPLASTQKPICVLQYYWKVELKGFPTVYGMPILGNIGVSYTIGKLLESTFHWKCANLRTSNALSVGVPGSVVEVKHFKYTSGRKLFPGEVT